MLYLYSLNKAPIHVWLVYFNFTFLHLEFLHTRSLFCSNVFPPPTTQDLVIPCKFQTLFSKITIKKKLWRYWILVPLQTKSEGIGVFFLKLQMYITDIAYKKLMLTENDLPPVKEKNNLGVNNYNLTILFMEIGFCFKGKNSCNC